MGDPRLDVRLFHRGESAARIRACLDEAYRRMERHFGCKRCRVSSPRWCADRNHEYCQGKRSHDNV